MIRVVGLDTSLTSTGIATVDLDCGAATWSTQTIESEGKATATLRERAARLTKLRNAITTAALSAQLVVIETPAYSRTMGSMHDRSGMWWLVVEELIVCGVPVVEVSTSQRAKYGTGKGNSPKNHVLAAAIRRYPNVPIIGDDIADATILAAMGARHLGCPVEESLPVAHLAAMDAVRWPTVGIVDVVVAGGVL